MHGFLFYFLLRDNAHTPYAAIISASLLMYIAMVLRDKSVIVQLGIQALLVA